MKLHTVRETAAALGLSETTIRKWLAALRIDFVKMGRSIRIPSSEIERIVRDNTRRARLIKFHPDQGTKPALAELIQGR